MFYYMWYAKLYEKFVYCNRILIYILPKCSFLRELMDPILHRKFERPLLRGLSIQVFEI